MAMVGLSLKEISSSQPMDKQENKFGKHKSVHETMLNKNNFKKQVIINSLVYLNILIIICLYINTHIYKLNNINYTIVKSEMNEMIMMNLIDF
jgi:hypothetical protein